MTDIEAIKEGIINVLASGYQDHRHTDYSDRDGGLVNFLPAGCHSKNLVRPRFILRPAYESTDYGYGGDSVPTVECATLLLGSECADCGNEVFDLFDVDDDLDMVLVLTILATVPDRDQFAAGLREARTSAQESEPVKSLVPHVRRRF